MIDPDTSTTGALAATGAILLGLFRWMAGRQIKRTDNLEVWQREAISQHAAMQADLATVKTQVNDMHKRVMDKL